MTEYSLTDKTLYQTCNPVPLGDDVSELIDGMKEVMYSGKGCGLAANQVGSDLRVIVVNAGKFRKTIINPVITKFSRETIVSEEGCLSFSGEKAFIARHRTVVVEGFTPKWKPFKQILKGLASRCVQHEVDHLNGISCIGDK